MRFTLDVTVVSARERPQGVKSGEIITERMFKWGHIGCSRKTWFISLDMKQSFLRYALHRDMSLDYMLISFGSLSSPYQERSS